MLDQVTALYLGPATVTRSVGRRVQLRRPEDPVESWAELALAFAYQPVPGDLVLLVAHEGRGYVIGVLQGRGGTVMTFPGDLVLSAPQGSIRIESAQEIGISAPGVEVRAERVELEARTLTQRIESAYHWVKDLLHIRAGQARTQVEGSFHQLAERTFIRSEKETKVDGEKIYLG